MTQANATSWKKGQSGNPKGRPKKKRALTQILARAGSAAVDYGGRRVSGKRLLALLLWQAAKTGRMTFEGGRIVEIETREWLDIVKFIYNQIDGPPRAEMDIMSGGEPLTIQYVNDWRDQTTIPTHGPDNS